MKLKTMVLFACCLLVGCTLGSTPDTGYIICKNDSSIWVVKSKKEDVIGKSESKLEKEFKYQGTFYDISNIDDTIKSKLKIGQRVTVYHSGDILLSAPSQGKAAHIKILEDD